MMCAEPGVRPMRKPSTVPRAIGIAGFAPFLPAGQQLAQLRRDHLADHVGRRRRENLAEPEQADRDRHDADAVAEFGDVERIAEMPGHVVDADHAEHQPEAGHQQRTRQRGRRHVGEEDQAEHEQRGVFRRAEPQRKVRERRRDQGEHDHAEGAGDPGADRGDAERGAGAALLRHGVAVDAGHHRGGFAGNAHQDRGGRAAVLRAVIDAGEHHHCAGGVEPEGRRQQNADARTAVRCPAARRPACRPGSRGRRTTARPAAAQRRSRASGCAACPC